jgi:hypothetical protein
LVVQLRSPVRQRSALAISNRVRLVARRTPTEADSGKGPAPAIDPIAYLPPLIVRSLKVMSQRLGRANPTMIRRVYARIVPNDDAKLTEESSRMPASRDVLILINPD